MLRIDDLHVRYGPIIALRGVSIEVGAGEIVSIIGPNGAGKSTLMHAVAGIVAPERGSIAFEGSSLLGKPIERIVAQGVALVPEQRGIFTSLTVGENVDLGGTVRRDRAALAADRERVLELFPVLRERFDSPAGQLSGGEQQQLAIARALLTRPLLMMLDEPSLGLAPMMIDLVYEIIIGLRREGMTILLVEQSAVRALDIADRTYVLRSGSIELSGSSAELMGMKQFDEAYFGFAGNGGGGGGGGA